MQPIVYSLEFNCSKKNIFSFNSADPALLKRLGYEKDNLSIDLLGLDSQILSSFISHHSEMEPQIPVQTLYLVNHLKEKKAFCAFNASYETQRERSFLKLFLIDTGPFVKVEHQLSKNEEKYRELVENANSIILRWDRNGYITYFNEFAQSFFGYSEEEIIGQHVMDTIVPKTESTGRDLSPLMNDICEHPENYESNINENCTKDGHRIWINWTNKVLKDDDESIIGALSIGTDITRQRQMEEELRHQHKMDAIGQLAGGIAHDFNNMLHGLMGFAEILHSRLEDKKLKSFAEKIITIGKQSSELTGQLLAFSRKGQYQLVSIDLHHELLELIMMLEHMLNKNISIESSMEAINPYIDGDQTQIKNSLLNLALNAKDAMPEGGTLSFKSSNVTLTKELMFQEKVNVAPGNYVRLDVCDTGCGMTNDTKDHAFEPFFTTKKNGKGTGMELAAVYGTLVNHGGSIVINSQPEEGTCFSLFFKSSDQQPEETIDEKQSLPKGKVSILLVDDEELIRNYTQELFEQYDYQIKTCANGLEAIKFFSESKDNIDLVILDMMMPQMGGRETFHQLKLIDPDVKVIVASGYGADEEVQTMLNDGVVDFIQKPFTMESLSKILQKVLNF